MLAPDGSFVIELGNAWEPGEPVMSTLALRAMLALLDAGGFKLCQQFVTYNPARLPSPIQWVNVERSRVKDAYTHVWWMARTPRPKADNRRVLTEYSESMKKLMKRGTYNAGHRRPSTRSARPRSSPTTAARSRPTSSRSATPSRSTITGRTARSTA